ncbi:MAG: NifU family protein [Culicoidibacterales bacterium]
MSKEETIAQIQDILNQLRPYIHQDGGDVEFVDFNDGIVQIRLLGACVGCGIADVTVKQGIEQALIEEVPGVIGVDDVTEHSNAMGGFMF